MLYTLCKCEEIKRSASEKLGLWENGVGWVSGSGMMAEYSQPRALVPSLPPALESSSVGVRWGAWGGTLSPARHKDKTELDFSGTAGVFYLLLSLEIAPFTAPLEPWGK